MPECHEKIEPAQAAATEEPDFSNAEELFERFPFPEYAKLQGPQNFELWKLTLSTHLEAINLGSFLEDPSITANLLDNHQAILHKLLWDSCTQVPQASIASIKNPTDAYTLLEKRYFSSPEFQRRILYSSYHKLTFKGYQGTLENFNAEFDCYLARLQLAGVKIDPIDQASQYLTAVGPVFTQWAGFIRIFTQSIQALGLGSKSLDLHYLMASLLRECRIPGTSAAKAYNRRRSQPPKKQGNSNTRSTRSGRPSRPGQSSQPVLSYHYCY
ncbi:hypothetical protein RJ55_02918 [Drechmeria coniospora]|nr:hypothetical protein RJ55_02918 [Drechmeria coniospora]